MGQVEVETTPSLQLTWLAAEDYSFDMTLPPHSQCCPFLNSDTIANEAL